jgi:hypothetical protein
MKIILIILPWAQWKPVEISKSNYYSFTIHLEFFVQAFHHMTSELFVRLKYD